MNNHSLYALLLSLFFLAPAIALPVVGYNSERLTGDETRLGGYLESDYGWNKPMEAFMPPRYQLSSRDYFQYTDVVVLGDSFSKLRRYSWPNFFHSQTGYSISVFDMHSKTIRDIVNTPAYQQRPPKFVIFETIERFLNHRFSEEGACTDTSIHETGVRHTVPLTDKSMEVQTVLKHRDTGNNIFRYDETYDFLKKFLARLRGKNITDVENLALVKDAPFSSRVKNRLLIIDEEREKAGWDKRKLKYAACMLSEFRNQVEQNGYTKFIVMIVPDKLTGYSKLLVDESLRKSSIINQLARHAGERKLAFPRFDKAIIQAIHDGETDVFLPNDTHLGSEGYKTLADHLFNYMKSKGLIYQEVSS